MTKEEKPEPVTPQKEAEATETPEEMPEEDIQKTLGKVWKTLSKGASVLVPCGGKLSDINEGTGCLSPTMAEI